MIGFGTDCTEGKVLQNSAAEHGEAWSEVRGHDRDLTHGTGIWREYTLLGLGAENETHAKTHFPFTAGLLAKVEAIKNELIDRVGF